MRRAALSVWLCACLCALLAVSGWGADGAQAQGAEPLRRALEQAIENARREVDRPAPAPEPCFGGDTGPRVAVVVGELSGRVPERYVPWVMPGAPKFAFDYPQMDPKTQFGGNLRLGLAPDTGRPLFDEALMMRRIKGLRPLADGVLLDDGRLDLGAGLSVIRGPEGTVLAVLVCAGDGCSIRWVAQGMELSAGFDAELLPQWAGIMRAADRFLSCAFPGRGDGPALRVD